jgi:ribosomal protein S18 acetylase RimI-like enzyme
MRIDGDTIGVDIHPNFRRKGYARLAYQKYLEDTDYADLWVFEDNHAKKLYEELGFVETGEYEMLRDRKYLKMIYEK